MVLLVDPKPMEGSEYEWRLVRQCLPSGLYPLEPLRQMVSLCLGRKITNDELFAFMRRRNKEWEESEVQEASDLQGQAKTYGEL